jgi:hypothetical protein
MQAGRRVSAFQCHRPPASIALCSRRQRFAVAQGVQRRDLGPEIAGIWRMSVKTVSMRDIIMQPGSKTAGPPMPNPMVCHILEGEMRIDQEGKVFTAKKNFCWTCNKDTNEQAFNDGSVVAVMRITDLMV